MRVNKIIRILGNPAKTDKSAMGAINRPLLVHHASIGAADLALARGATTLLAVNSSLTEHDGWLSKCIWQCT